MSCEGALARRLLAAQIVVDESTAMAAAQDDPDVAEAAFWTTGLYMFVFWNTGTLVGALGGNAIGDPATLGLDAAFPAGFIALLAPQLRRRPAPRGRRDRRGHRPDHDPLPPRRRTRPPGLLLGTAVGALVADRPESDR